MKDLNSTVKNYFDGLKESYNNLLGWEQDISRREIISELYSIVDPSISINNVGDAWTTLTSEKIHTKIFEKELIEFFIEKYKTNHSKDTIWGCITPGGTISNLQALLNGRNQLESPIGLYSEVAHHSVKKSFDCLNVPSIELKVDDNGRIDLEYLKSVLKQISHDILINVTFGTTLFGTSDDIITIKELLKDKNHYIHCDAAFFGGYIPFLDEKINGLNFDYFDSLSISGHKFFGLSMPASLLLINKNKQKAFCNNLCITKNVNDFTLVGSRDGHSPLIWWYIINKIGETGFKNELKKSFEIKNILINELTTLGFNIFSNENYSLLLPISAPSRKIIEKYSLPEAEFRGTQVTRLTIMSHVDLDLVNRFLEDIKNS
jgi:histidine decarboxylase